MTWRIVSASRPEPTPQRPIIMPKADGPITREMFCTIEFIAMALGSVSSVVTSKTSAWRAGWFDGLREAAPEGDHVDVPRQAMSRKTSTASAAASTPSRAVDQTMTVLRA